MRSLLLCTSLLMAIVSKGQEPITFDQVMKKVVTGKQYTLVVLNKAKEMDKDKAAEQKMLETHLIHLFELERDGKISVFGPVQESKETEGIIVFNSTDEAEIKQELEQDPFVKGGYMAYKMYKWFSIPGQNLK